MRSPKGVNDTSIQNEAGPLLILARIEDNLSLAVVVGARARIGSLNIYRSTELFRAGSEIERVYPLKVGGGVLAHCHHIDGAVRAGKWVYHRRSRNPDFRNNLAAAARIGGRFAASKHRSAPQYRSEVRVAAIDGIVLSGNYHDVVDAAVGNRNVGCNQRLGIYFPIHVNLKELPEAAEVNVCRRELRFSKILPGSR